MFDGARSDLLELKRRFGGSLLKLAVTNRGWHALLAYRFAHWMFLHKCRFGSEVLTRIVQVIYGIDIDYRCTIEGGVVIIHGIGLVVGQGAYVSRGVALYHQVTLGIRGTPCNDGFPRVGAGCTLGAGSKLLGPIQIGEGSVVAANAVVTQNVAASSLVASHGALTVKPLSEQGGMSDVV